MKTNGNNTREKIIQQATVLFNKKGYHNASIREICENVGISKGGFFHYFKTKEDILHIIHEQFINYELIKAEEVIKKNMKASTTLKILIMDLIEIIGKFKPSISVFFQEKRFFSKEKFESIREKRDRYEEIYLKTLKKGIENGEFRDDLDPNIMVKAIFGTCNWTYQWLNPEGKLPPRAIGELFYEIICDGIKVDENISNK